MLERTILAVFLLLWTQDLVGSVRLTELRVPTDMPEGGMALISCHYDMGADELYSVKWYKDGREFYRYVPKNEPPLYKFDAPGVNVDLSRSSNTVVALLNLTQESAGVYRCEVSGEAPNFTTVYKERRINVYLLPKSGPYVSGLKKEYFVDEILVANCSLPPTSKATLTWLLNDQPAPPEYIQGPWLTVSADRPDIGRTTLQIGFIVSPTDFVNGAMKLKCRATIPPLYQSETESLHYLAQAVPETEADIISSASVVSFATANNGAIHKDDDTSSKDDTRNNDVFVNNDVNAKSDATINNDFTAVAEVSKDYASSTESEITAILIPIVILLITL